MNTCDKCNKSTTDNHCGCNHYDGFNLSGLLNGGGTTGNTSTVGTGTSQSTSTVTTPKKKINLAGIENTVGNLLSGLKSKSQSQNSNMGSNMQSPAYNTPQAAQPSGSGNTGLIIGVVLAIIVIAGIFIYTQRK